MKLLRILVFLSICFTQELKVEGNLNVTGAMINDSLAQVIAVQQAEIVALQDLIAQLQAQIDAHSYLLDSLLNGVVTAACTDYDGNSYETVIIGNQLWMSENLKVTHYNNGDEIPNITNNGDWGSYDEGQYGVYNNNPTNANIYGNLYNWAVVDDSRGVCPVGWHVPSDDEIKTLEMFLGMSEFDANSTGYRGTNEGSKLSGNAELWNSGDLEQNSEFGTSGFTGLPAGYRDNSFGIYYDMGSLGSFWSSTVYDSDDAWYRLLYSPNSEVLRYSNYKRYGFSIRCLRD